MVHICFALLYKVIQTDISSIKMLCFFSSLFFSKVRYKLSSVWLSYMYSFLNTSNNGIILFLWGFGGAIFLIYVQGYSTLCCS